MLLRFGILIFMVALRAPHALPSFPGAEGWGAVTPGGRGGPVLIVTNTNASGPGSFFEALRTQGPRTIVFRTSGVITFDRLADPAFEPNAPYSNFTIAGQTSPGGITLKGTFNNNGGSILWCYAKCRDGGNFHDGIFRFLRFRGTVQNADAVTFTYAHNFVFDHCDFSGGSDETLDLSHDSTFTVQWCTIANSTYGPGSQCYGSLMAYNPSCRITLHHNLWGNFIHRAPLMHWSDISGYHPPFNGSIEYSNSIDYNILQAGFHIGSSECGFQGGDIDINFVGNYYKTGPNTEYGVWRDVSLCNARVYAADNAAELDDGSVSYTIWETSVDPDGDPDPRYKNKMATRWPFPPVTYTSATQAYEDVCNWVGAFPRDSMNRRTVSGVRTGTGDFTANGTNDNDPSITSGPAAPADADNDGMPDFWEDGMGLNKNGASDNNQDKDGDGYTNIEEYINDLAQARVCRDYENPVYPIPNNWTDYNPACCKSLAVEGGLPANVDKTHTIQVSPNPFFGGVLNIRPPSRRGELRILDVQGRLVRALAAEKNLIWDGGDAAGKRIAQGLYQLYWVENGKIEGRRQIVVLK